jgi:hypothetical protein
MSTAQVFRRDTPGKAAQWMSSSIREILGCCGQLFDCFQCEQASLVQLQSILPCTVKLRSFDSWSRIGVYYSLFGVTNGWVA